MGAPHLSRGGGAERRVQYDRGVRRLSDLNVGNRSTAAVLRAPLQPEHYRALLAAFRLYPTPIENLRRYLTAGGAYPYVSRVRTPAGERRATLYSSHDISTLTEVFCREDYRCGPDIDVVVDVGANIGISALYFLTRNERVRVYLFEPDPRNVERLRGNLAGLEDRTVIEQAAVALVDGQVPFGTEPSGRYGRIGEGYGETILVPARALNDALRAIIEREGHIDVLKIDTEGSEPELVGGLESGVLDHTRTIYFESNEPEPLHSGSFEHAYACQTNRLRRRAKQS